MKIKTLPTVRAPRFLPKSAESFYSVAKQRVEEYMQKQKSNQYNTTKYIKTAIILGMFLVPYLLVVFGITQSILLFLVLWVLMGIGKAGIGLSIMHDANHGSLSRKKNVNNLFGLLMDFIGGSSVNWKIQHNFLHHTYTNIDGFDEDIDPGPVLRLSPNAPLKKMQRFQHIYAWFVYGLMTLFWVFYKDYKQLTRYKKKGLLKRQGYSYKKEMTKIIGFKAVYLAYIFVLPLLFSGMAWWVVLIGFLSMHFVLGFLLAIVFQSAHVVEDAEFPPLKENGKIENNWAIHQMHNTANFSPKNKLFFYFVGGLNYQIEHHLFPQINHLYYPKLSKIVQKTAMEFGVPYYVKPTFAQAVWSHGKMLKKLGHK